MARRPLPADIKEHICRIIYNYDIRHTFIPAPRSQRDAHAQKGGFDNVNVTLSHVDSEWRRVALKYAWRTIRVTSHATEASLAEIRLTHGHFTRKLYILVQFKSVNSAQSRRYSFTQENKAMQPFCDLPLWPHLEELEVDYAHKCAFPGLAKYIEPRLGNIRVLAVTGRVPIDMRRGVLFMKAAELREIHIRAMVSEKDSLSTIATVPDSILTRPVMQTLTRMSITPMIDVRVARWVLSTQKQTLRWLDVNGFNSEQLSVIGLFCSNQPDLVALSQQSHVQWRCLESLTVSMVNLMPMQAELPVSFSLDAAEFPQLQRLRMRLCSHSALYSRTPLDISYCQTFTTKWTKLVSLEIPALDDNDAILIAQNMPQLGRLYVPAIADMPQPSKSYSVTALWYLLTSGLPLKVIHIASSGSERTVICCETYPPTIDFAHIRLFHPLQVLHIPQTVVSSDQLQDIRYKCLRLSQVVTKQPKPLSPTYQFLWSILGA